MGKYSFKEENKEDLPEFVAEEKKDIHKTVDTALSQIQDKIKVVEEIRRHPPKPGFMETEILPGKYAIDLNALYNAQLSDCPGTIIPMLIDHAVRTNLDIRDSYRVEKRRLDFKYWWVIFLMIGIIAMAWVAMLMFG